MGNNDDITLSSTKNTLEVGSLTLDAGTYSDTDVVVSDNSFETNLVTAGGVSLGTLSVDEATNTGVVTLTDGKTYNVSGSGHLAAESASTPPLQVLSDYLGDLGYGTSPSSLATDNFNDENPTGTPYTVTGYHYSSGGENYDEFTLSSASLPGAVVTGGADPDAGMDPDPQFTNILDAAGDITQDTISGIDTLNVTGDITLTSSQLASFGTIEGSGTITLAGGGTIDLTDSAFTGSFSLAAGSWEGTTLTGNDRNGQSLYASLYGDDTLTAGSGTGDFLYAGDGVDTITTGSAGDTVVAADGFAPGSSVTDGSGYDLLEAAGDISQASLSNIHLLEILTGDTITLTPSQLAGLTLGIFTHDAAPGEIDAAEGGTFSLVGVPTYDQITLNATSDADTTLIGNDFPGTLTPSYLVASGDGNDTLIAGNGAGNLLTASGNGNDGLYTGSGDGAQLLATGDGNDILSAGDGNGDSLAATGTGASYLTAGNGSGDSLTASNGTDVLTTGSGAGDILTATTGGNALYAGGGAGDVLNAAGGGNLLSGGNGGDTFNIADDDNLATGGERRRYVQYAWLCKRHGHARPGRHDHRWRRRHQYALCQRLSDAGYQRRQHQQYSGYHGYYRADCECG